MDGEGEMDTDMDNTFSHNAADTASEGHDHDQNQNESVGILGDVEDVLEVNDGEEFYWQWSSSGVNVDGNGSSPECLKDVNSEFFQIAGSTPRESRADNPTFTRLMANAVEEKRGCDRAKRKRKPLRALRGKDMRTIIRYNKRKLSEQGSDERRDIENCPSPKMEEGDELKSADDDCEVIPYKETDADQDYSVELPEEFSFLDEYSLSGDEDTLLDMELLEEPDLEFPVGPLTEDDVSIDVANEHCHQEAENLSHSIDDCLGADSLSHLTHNRLQCADVMMEVEVALSNLYSTIKLEEQSLTASSFVPSVKADETYSSTNRSCFGMLEFERHLQCFQQQSQTVALPEF